jgi:hypothetical protein
MQIVCSRSCNGSGDGAIRQIDAVSAVAAVWHMYGAARRRRAVSFFTTCSRAQRS